MMYDFHGVWEETSLVNHHSSLYSNDNLNVVSSTSGTVTFNVSMYFDLLLEFKEIHR